MALKIAIAGWSAQGPATEIPDSLDGLIYAATSGAVIEAGLHITDVDGVVMASSDVDDGRAISTMTLTGSTGSFHKSELRACNDGLAAVLLAAAEIGAGASQRLIVCSWHKASDVVNPAAVPALALEPTMHRALGYHPDAVLSLRQSAESGRVVVTGGRGPVGADLSVAMVLVDDDVAGDAVRAFTGFGSSMAPYLRPGTPVLRPLRQAAAAALEMSRVDASAVAAVYVGGLHRIADAAIAEAVSVSSDRVVRCSSGFELGYAAGLSAAVDAHRSAVDGTVLVLSSSGLGYQQAHAAVLEMR